MSKTGNALSTRAKLLNKSMRSKETQQQEEEGKKKRLVKADVRKETELYKTCRRVL
jgi:hypothetical protein